MLSTISKKMIPFVVSLAMFMEALDATVINTAIPSMAESLLVNPIDLKIALISYLLSLAIFIPISGWIADKFGIKRVFMGALIIFSVSSLWCGFSHNLIELVIARTIQGIGGALMLPIGRLIIVRSFKRHELIITMSRVVMIGAFGLLLGPVFGGVISHYLTWRWIFWINIPVGIINIILAYIYLIEYKPKNVMPLDILGFVLFGAGLAGLTFGFSALSESSMAISISLSIILIAILFLSLYVKHSRKIKYPIVRTDLFQIRTFQVAILGNVFSRLGFGALPFLLPLMLQISLGYPAQISGMLLAPIAIGLLFAKNLIMPLLRWLGFKKILMINTFLVGASMWLFTSLNAGTSFYLIGFYTFLFGLLVSIQYSAMNSLCFADIDQESFSAATSIMSTVQQISQTFGVAISAILVQSFIHFGGLTLANIKTIQYTLVVMGFLTLISIVIFLRLKPSDGQVMLTANNK
jgi:EmrB/QacA subfamily drug resistance transporter